VIGADPPHDRLVVIGEVVRVHGLDGAVRVRAISDHPDRFVSLEACVLWDPDSDTRVPVRIERASQEADRVVLKLRGMDDVEAARHLVGQVLAVPERDALPLPEGQFYPWQLEGCRVETEDGVIVGEVKGIERSPAHDLWVVATGQRECLVPAVPEIVVEVSLADRRVVIRPPEGLLEL
jgi:16S rRNA processing protein RimM